MTPFHNITKMVKHIIHRQNGGVDREAVVPAREWLLGIVVISLLVIAGGLFGFSIYYNVYENEGLAVVEPTVAVPYQARTVDMARERFSNRQKTYDALRGTAVVVPASAVAEPESLPEEPKTDAIPDTPVTPSEEDIAKPVTVVTEEVSENELVIDGGVEVAP